MNEARWPQVLILPRLSVQAPGIQVSIDALGGSVRIADDQVSGHESGRVVRPVLAGSESVDAFDDVLPAQVRVVAGDAVHRP